MNRTIIALLAFAGTICSANAQLTVSENGQSLFGERKSSSSLGTLSAPATTSAIGGTTPITPPTLIAVDTLANAVFLGSEAKNGGGYITFGGGKGRVYVGEVPSTSGTPSNRLRLGGAFGLQIECMGGKLMSFTNSTSNITRPLYIYTDVRANSFVVDSDSRLKSNIVTLDDTEGLFSLTPVSYNLASQSAPSMQKASLATDDEVEPLTPDDRTRFGFIAQEVKEIYPELVVEDENGVLGIDYIGFIPLLVDAVKNLQATVNEQKNEIDRLTSGQSARRSSPGASAVESIASSVTLGQNRPNPFSGTASIACNIPSSVQEAEILVFDMQGQQKLRIPVTEREGCTVTIDGSRLTPGMYIYSLITDGVEADSKRMILTD